MRHLKAGSGVVGADGRATVTLIAPAQPGAALVIVGVGAIVLTTQRHRSARHVNRRR